jgi:hypothetical protein
VKPSSDGEYGLEESEGDQEGDVESESEDELAMRRSKRTRVNSRGRGKAGQREAKPKPKEWALRERVSATPSANITASLPGLTGCRYSSPLSWTISKILQRRFISILQNEETVGDTR